MSSSRVILIGGTSHAGKSSVGTALAERLGFELQSSDRLGRHPGRPWPTERGPVPEHVAEHYGRLSLDRLIQSVLGHYRRLRPKIDALVDARREGVGAPLVLEGSALSPELALRHAGPSVCCVWLHLDPAELRRRIRRESGYERLDAAGRKLADAFGARAERFQDLVLSDLDRLRLPRLDAGRATPEELAREIARRAGFGPAAARHAESSTTARSSTARTRTVGVDPAIDPSPNADGEEVG